MTIILGIGGVDGLGEGVSVLFNVLFGIIFYYNNHTVNLFNCGIYIVRWVSL